MIMRKMRKQVAVRYGLLLRAENLKKLEEQRAEKLEELKTLTSTVETEQRAFTEEEENKFNTLEKEIKAIDATIVAQERARKLEFQKNKKKKINDDDDEDMTLEERAFVDYIRGVTTEERATNLTMTDNGAIIPKSIMKKIIEKVVDICPVYQKADRYNLKGNISIPYYDETSGAITMAYQDEFTELSSNVGKFKSIDLSGYLAGALSVISRRAINNSEFDVLGKIIEYMSVAISKFIEHECLIGTSGKCDGMSKMTNIVTAAAPNKITGDELIDVQEAIPDVYQQEAIWIMNKKTRIAIRKLKDNDGNYLLNRDMSAKWGYTLLGKDVYCSDNMPTMGEDVEVIIYGDMTGLAVKVAEEASIEVLREKYATQHAIGVVSWLEIDTKVQNEQKLAKLKMAAGVGG